MKTRFLHAAAGALAAASATPAPHALAQQTAAYSFVFTSPGATAGNGTANITVAPNSAVTAQVLVWFTPGIGHQAQGPGTLVGTVQGLQSGAFSITGAGSAGPGWGTPFSLTPPYNALFLGANPGTPAGQSHNGVVWVIGFIQWHPLPENPGKVWSGTYHTGATGSVNLSFTGLAPTGVWAQPQGGPLPFWAIFDSNAGPGGSITVVPAPAGLALLGLGGFPAVRRRR